MATEYFTNPVFPTDKVFQNLQELYALNAATAEKLFAQQKAVADIFVESGTKQFELLRKADSYQKVVENQKALTNEYREKLAEIAKETVSIVFDGTDKYAQWARERVAEVEAIQPVTKAATAKKAA